MNLKLLFSTLILPCALFAQNPLALDSLKVNNLKIVINADGEMHRNQNETCKSEMPIGSNLTPVYNQQLWFGGIDETQSLRIAASTYKQAGNDFWPGPVATNYNLTYQIKYNNVWHLTKADIEFHRNNYFNQGYVTPDEILDWPGNGNVSNGEAVNLAPYMDLNNNNIYEPELGDFPLIRGDEALYVIYNDMRHDHTESGGEKVGIEIHHMLYAYNNNGNESNDNTYYSHFEIYNRGTSWYYDFLIGNWIDFDLGYFLDDYIQTDVERNLLMVYNGDSLDETNNGYGLNPPVYGCTQLNKDLDYSMSYNNTPDAVNGNPINPEDYKNYMIAKYRNGNNLTDLNGNVSSYIFPSTSVEDSLVWDEQTAGNLPGDRRILGSSVFYNFNPGTSICLDYASVFVRDTTLTSQNQLERLQDLVDDVHDFYDNQYTDCSDVSDLGVFEINYINGNEIQLLEEGDAYFLESNNEFEQEEIVIISDVLGKQQSSSLFEIGTNSHLLKTDHLTKGIYFVTLGKLGNQNSFKLIID